MQVSQPEQKAVGQAKAHCAMPTEPGTLLKWWARYALPTRLSSPGLTGRPSIPETLMIEPRSRAYWLPPARDYSLGVARPSHHTKLPRLRQPPRLDRVDLQRDEAAVDAALREGAAGEPQAGLRRADPHVAQFLRVVVKTPDPADARGDLRAEQLRRPGDPAPCSRSPARPDRPRSVAPSLQRQAIGRERLDVGRLDQADLAVGDQLGTADVEIIAAAAGAEFQRPAGAVLAEFEPETGPLQPRQQRRVELASPRR